MTLGDVDSLRLDAVVCVAASLGNDVDDDDYADMPGLEEPAFNGNPEVDMEAVD